MNRSSWERAKSLLADAADLPMADRERFIVEHCPDPALRREVLDLLASPAPVTAMLEAGALRPGMQLGPYVIEQLLGRGGMGEVYRARDTQLGREVAIKILPPLYTADLDRLARFEREARVLATLNHHHIAAIYGVVDGDGVPALVLEFVDGETLAERLQRGPLPVGDACRFAHQIADALDAAHERGVVHRDLKPANIVLTRDGNVKVLDFGLAKFDPSRAGESEEAVDARVELSQAPIGIVGGTRDGVILGTPTYMSPEQARGNTADKRSDIWAFGCVLYEMLTGRPAFAGQTLSETVAAILVREPEWGGLPDATPPRIRTLLRRCLHKEPKRRLRDIGDALLEMQDTDAAASEVTPGFRLEGRERMAWVAVASLIVALVAAVAVPGLKRAERGEGRVTRTTIELPVDQELDLDFRAAPLALSPDGTLIVYAVDNDGRKQLYLRKLRELEATPVPDTTGATQPFFSPDSEWVAFFARGMLQKVAVRGGAPLQICKVTGVSAGGSWGPDNTIVFATLDSGLSAVAAAGGQPRLLTKSRGAMWPEILPDGKTVLFTSDTIVGSGTAIVAMAIDTGASHYVARSEGATEPSTTPVIGPGPVGPVRYVPTGHLVFGQGASRMRAIRFDPKSLTLGGAAASMVDSVLRSSDGGPLYFAVSSTGMLVYAPEDFRRQLVWVDRGGQSMAVGFEAEAFRYPSVSPDGKRIAIDINTEERRSEVWIYDTERATRVRLTSKGHNLLPVWNPDSTRVTFASDRSITWRPPDGSGNEEVLVPGENWMYPTSWSPDGRDLVYTSDTTTTGMDLWVVTRAAGTAPRPLLARPFHDAWAQFSPDGHWLAYTSDESGVNEVYIAHYPDLEARVAVSNHGGTWPVWSRKKSELFYRQGSAVMAVPIQTTPTLRIGSPERLFSGPYVGVDGDRKFDVTPDGQRFLMVARNSPAVAQRLVVVSNWFEELQRHLPALH